MECKDIISGRCLGYKRHRSGSALLIETGKGDIVLLSSLMFKLNPTNIYSNQRQSNWIL